MYRKKGERFLMMTVANPSSTRKKVVKSEWDIMADIAEKCMKSKKFTAEDVKRDLKKIRKSI